MSVCFHSTAGYQNESLLNDVPGSNGKVSYRAMDNEFKASTHLNPVLGFTKGQFQTQIENDFDLLMKHEYPTESVDRADDVTNYGKRMQYYPSLWFCCHGFVGTVFHI